MSEFEDIEADLKNSGIPKGAKKPNKN